MILAATLLWSVEVVVRQAAAGVGCRRSTLASRADGQSGPALLLGWVAVSGRRASSRRLDVEQWRWVLLTGLLLTAYVATWYAALARAQAIDVTAVLVFGAVVTALLSGAADGAHGQRRRHDARRAGAVLAAVARASPAGRPEAARRDRRRRRRSCSRATPTRRTRSGSAAPTAPRTLLEYGDAHASDGGLAELARTFDGAWPYLDADRRRERASPIRWTRVSSRPTGSATSCSTACGPPSSRGTSTTASAAGSAGPASMSSTRSRRARCPTTASTSSRVYPWLGLLRTGVVDEPLRILDQCRTTPGLASSVDGRLGHGARAAALVRGRRPAAGRAGAAHRALARRRPRLRPRRSRPGDLVSLHWDFVCDVLSPAAALRSSGRIAARSPRWPCAAERRYSSPRAAPRRGAPARLGRCGPLGAGGIGSVTGPSVESVIVLPWCSSSSGSPSRSR